MELEYEVLGSYKDSLLNQNNKIRRFTIQYVVYNKSYGMGHRALVSHKHEPRQYAADPMNQMNN